jgi:hypothetical protein
MSEPGPDPRGRRLQVALLATAVVGTGALIATLSLADSRPRASTPTVAAPSTSASVATPSTPAQPRQTEPPGWPGFGKPPVPATGSYVGAWVRPEPYSQPGRVSSVRRFEQAVRKLDIVGLYRKVDDPFPTESDRVFARDAVLQLSWASPDIKEVAAGKHDDLLRARARSIRTFGEPLLLRWRWEMDRPNLSTVVHSPADFVQAWRHIRSVFADEGATNVGWVWCPTAQGFADGRAQRYYPGDDQVDWLCADVYPEKPWIRGGFQPFEVLADPFVRWAAGHPKPIVIGEYGVAESYRQLRADWLRGMATYVRKHPQIKALLYYEESRPESPDYYRFALDGDPAAVGALRTVATEPHFDPLGRADR